MANAGHFNVEIDVEQLEKTSRETTRGEKRHRGV